MRLRPLACAVILLIAMIGVTHAAPPEEAIIPIERYTTEKGRSLALAYRSQLRQIYDTIHGCHDWMEIPKRGLGFITPRGVPGDERYLNLWVWIDQKMTPAFAAAPPHLRASAMFQRYGLDLLRRLSIHPPLRDDPSLTGFSVVLTWMKPDGEPRHGVPGVNETLSVFVDKATLKRFLEGEVSAAEFVERAAINGFDGRTDLGRLPLQIQHPGPARAIPTDGRPAC